MGRYILGLLGGLKSIAAAGPEGDGVGGAQFQAVPLFAPAAALLPDGPPSAPPLATGLSGGASRPAGSLGLLRAARSVAKTLPFAYQARELVRAAALARTKGLDVFHETNHAAPRTRLPVVLTVHDLCCLLYPETQEPGRARFFSRALRERTRWAVQVITPTEAIARQVTSLLGVEPARVRAVHHGVDPALLSALELPLERPPALAAAGVGGGYLLFVGALEPRKGLPTLLDAYDLLPPSVARAHLAAYRDAAAEGRSR